MDVSIRGIANPREMDEVNEHAAGEGGRAEGDKWSNVCAHNKLKFQCKECCGPVPGDGKCEPIVIDSDEVGQARLPLSRPRAASSGGSMSSPPISFSLLLSPSVSF